MIYIFRVGDAGFLKLGFTRGSPWTRVATGFWSNLHPAACCQKLGWDDLELLHCFAGDEEAEKAIKQQVPPHSGEFWPECQLEALLACVASLCDPLPVPEKPEQRPEVERFTEKLPCCGGPQHHCESCQVTFLREHHLRQHYESCKGWKVQCAGCVKGFLKRNLKRHQSTCKPYRQQLDE